MIALTAGRTVHDNFMRPRQPVFVNVEIGCLPRCRGWLADKPCLRSDFLELGPSIAPHGQHREAVHFFNFPHHCQHRFHWQRIGLDKVGLQQRQVFSVNAAGCFPVIAKRCAGHFHDFAWNLVRSYGNDPDATESDNRKGQSIITR